MGQPWSSHRSISFLYEFDYRKKPFILQPGSMMQDSRVRSIIKAISWRVFGTLSTIMISFVFTHKLAISLYIGLFEFISKIGFFYFHERIWNRFSFGLRNNKPEPIQ